MHYNSTVTGLTNQLTIVHETLESAVSTNSFITISDFIQKQLTDLEIKCWRNTKYTEQEFVEIVGIPNNTEEEEKVCKLVSPTTGVKILFIPYFLTIIIQEFWTRECLL